MAAADALGRATALGYGCEPNYDEATRLLLLGAQGGVPRAMARLGVYRIRGIGGLANPVEGEYWLDRAAMLGAGYGYSELGELYENGVPELPRDFAKATAAYSIAAVHGEGSAWKKLQALEQKSVAGAKLQHAIAEVHFRQNGGWLPSARIREGLQTLREQAAADPRALVELGQAHLEGTLTKRDYALARDYLQRALAAGNEDARFFLAKAKLRGWGEERAVEPALVELRAMADLGNAHAAAYLGYLHYWGAAEAPGIQKDAKLAYAYSRAAAEGGSLPGLLNLETCYEHGIGVAVNYALAAKVSWVLLNRGVPNGLQMTRKLLNHVPPL